MSIKNSKHVIVKAQIELAVETVSPPLSMSGGRLATDIRSRAVEGDYVKTPDGWFVPIPSLLSRVEDVADFLHFEMLQCGGELEIVGGFEILTENAWSLGISASSTFRFAMDMANAIIDLGSGKTQSAVFVNNQEEWKLFLDRQDLEIWIDRIAQTGLGGFRLPAKELKEQIKAARNEVAYFVQQLEPLLLAYRDTTLTSEKIRWVFGLDILSRNTPEI